MARYRPDLQILFGILNVSSALLGVGINSGYSGKVRNLMNYHGVGYLFPYSLLCCLCLLYVSIFCEHIRQ